MQGLRLTLGGASLAPHSVAGVPGLYRPDIPTPVGGEGELSLEEAKRLDADEGVPLELVSIKKADEGAVREQVGTDLDAARQGVAAAMRSQPEGAEPARIRQEAEAISAAPTATAPADGGEEG